MTSQRACLEADSVPSTMLKSSHYIVPGGDSSCPGNSCSLLAHLHLYFQVPGKEKIASSLIYIVKGISLLFTKSLLASHELFLPKHEKRCHV